ncbi:MAG: hypothetical protein HOP31_00145 [Ignavibacteria bacterium]|nr:hypothetical protein [Ignavibacteria bacterium]
MKHIIFQARANREKMMNKTVQEINYLKNINEKYIGLLIQFKDFLSKDLQKDLTDKSDKENIQ